MRVTIVRSMPNFSMDVYADGIISGLQSVRPDWQITDLKPNSIDRQSRSVITRAHKAYERFWSFPKQVQNQLETSDIIHIVDHSEGHIVRWLHSRHSAVVVTCHDLINYFYRDNLQGSVRLPFVSDYLWLASVRSIQKASRVVTVSAETAKDVNNILSISPDKINVVPNAVASSFRVLDESRRVAIRHRVGVKKDIFCLLNIGSDHPRKNIDSILKVLAQLLEKGLPVQFWKAGADFTFAQKEWIHEQALTDHIVYLGHPNKQELVDTYNAADVLLAPSFHEGFGLTLLESLACGTPVITSNVSAMPEVVGDAGILVSPDDVEAMANAVCHLYRDTDYRQKLMSTGLKQAQSFTWEKTSEQIAQVYETIRPRSRL